MRLERRARRRHQRRRPRAARRRQREVGRRRARVARAPAVLVEVLRAAHRVPPLDAPLRHPVLPLQLRGAPRAALAPAHHVPLALLELGALLPERVRPLDAFRAAVERLGAQHARVAARGLAVQRLGPLELGAVVLVLRRRARRGLALQRRAVALPALERRARVRRVQHALERLVVVRHRLEARGLRARVDVLLVVVVALGGGAAVLLLGVVVLVAVASPPRDGPARVRLVARRGRVAVVAREPGGLQLVRSRGRRHHRALAAGGRRAGAGLVVALAVVRLVRVRDAAVVQGRRTVERAQLLIEGARQTRHKVTGSYNNRISS